MHLFQSLGVGVVVSETKPELWHELVVAQCARLPFITILESNCFFITVLNLNCDLSADVVLGPLLVVEALFAHLDRFLVFMIDRIVVAWERIRIVVLLVRRLWNSLRDWERGGEGTLLIRDGRMSQG